MSDSENDYHEADQVRVDPAAWSGAATNAQEAFEEIAAASAAAHIADASDAHDASAISILDAANDFTAIDVEGALAEIQSDNEAHVAAADPHTGYVREADANWIDLTDAGSTTLHTHPGGGGAPTDADYLVGTAHGDLSAEIVVGTTPGGELGGTWAAPTVDGTHSGSTHSAATDTHIADASDAHDASAISIADAGGYFAATEAEAGLQELALRTKYATIAAVIDGGGSVIATGIAGDLTIDFACTIEAVTLLADVAGAAVVDIWVDTYANYPPTDADSITAAAPPTIAATNIKSQDTTLTGWDVAIAAGETLRFNVDSCATIERLTVSLKVRRT